MILSRLWPIPSCCVTSARSEKITFHTRDRKMNSLHCPLNMSYNSCFEILWFESNSILNWFFTLLSSPYFWKCVYLSYFGLYEAKGWIIVRAILTPGSQWGDCLYDWWLKFFSFYALNYYPHGDSLCYTITSCYVRNYLCPLLMPLRLILYILTLLSTFSVLFSRTSPLLLTRRITIKSFLTWRSMILMNDSAEFLPVRRNHMQVTLRV